MPSMPTQSPSPENPVLEARELDCGYSRRVPALLRGVNLRLAPGQLLALVGPNGAGKSTLLRTLCGLERPMDGTLTLGGKLLHTLAASERARLLSVVLTALPPVGEMRVLDLLRLGRYPYRGAWGQDQAGEERLHQVATDLSLLRFLERPLYQLSDGERQRVLIGRALVQDSPLMLLDEPTHYLDVVQRAAVFSLLRRLARQEGRGMLVATHEVEWALSVADRIAVVWHGGVWSGTAEDLLETGLVERAYPSDEVVFDRSSGRFVLRAER
jgi:iron complex transport system ATP-binding protein